MARNVCPFTPMPRYVLLRHDCPPAMGRSSHWDFMLEHTGALWTWALQDLPAEWQRQLAIGSDDTFKDEVRAERLADHRLDYLEYEGPLSEGRGNVRRIATGIYALVEASERRIVARLAEPLSGIALLSRSDRPPMDWQLIRLHGD